MEIREVDVFDEAEFHAYFDNLRAAVTFEREDAPMWSERECAVMFRTPEETETWTAVAAFEDGVLVGGGFFVMPLLDNMHMVWCEVHVAPANRRRGVGSELLEDIIRRSKEAGRTEILLESTYPFDQREDHPYRRFAEKHGFTPASTEINRKLHLPVRETLLEAWIDEAAARHTGYTIETYVGELPERVLPSFVHVMNQLAVEAPTGDIEFEAEAMTPETWRVREQKLKEQGRRMYRAAALDHRGDVVAGTVLAVPADDPDKVYQWATLVLPEHRGHRLGLAVKAHNLRAMQRDNPDRREVWTSNEESNGPMLDINVRMGFEVVDMLVEFQRKL